jgi:hypothetical protein
MHKRRNDVHGLLLRPPGLEGALAGGAVSDTLQTWGHARSRVAFILCGHGVG